VRKNHRRPWYKARSLEKAGPVLRKGASRMLRGRKKRNYAPERLCEEHKRKKKGQRLRRGPDSNNAKKCQFTQKGVVASKYGGPERRGLRVARGSYQWLEGCKKKGEENVLEGGISFEERL